MISPRNKPRAIPSQTGNISSEVPFAGSEVYSSTGLYVEKSVTFFWSDFSIFFCNSVKCVKDRILAFVSKTDAMNIVVKAIKFKPASLPVKCL